jgi:hypothetical protein
MIGRARGRVVVLCRGGEEDGEGKTRGMYAADGVGDGNIRCETEILY